MTLETIRRKARNLHAKTRRELLGNIAVPLGVAVFSGLGVRGALANQEITVYSETAHAGYPATSPYATAVGGTMLYAKNGAIAEEVVWKHGGIGPDAIR